MADQERSWSRGSPHVRRVLDPLRLRLLVEVERRGSITAAARACSLAQPTASTHLRTLEAAVGHRLIERAGRATRLTDAGRLLARQGAMVLSALDGFEQELADLEAGRSGTVQVAACQGFGNYVLPDLIAAFLDDYPRADVQVHVGPSGDVFRWVMRGDAHLGIAGPTRPSRRVRTERLVRDDFVGITAPLHHALRGVVDAATLNGLALVLAGPDSSSRPFAEELLSNAGSHIARVVELDSVEAVKRAVRTGLGVAFVSHASVVDELARGELRSFTIAGAPSTERWLELLLPVDRTLTLLEAAFAALLRERIARPGGTWRLSKHSQERWVASRDRPSSHG
jgi:molybdate transport repressor ModE-like protein